MANTLPSVKKSAFGGRIGYITLNHKHGKY